jgi:hypothetical protein
MITNKVMPTEPYSTATYRHGLCAVYVWKCFDHSLEFGVRISWKWVSVYAGNVIWAGESDSEWQALADGLFRFRCVAGFDGDAETLPLPLYQNIVDAGLAEPCV